MTKRQLTKLAALLQLVRQATEKRGKKTELAKFLGTSPQALNDWLSGRYSPGGEVTLQMLEWVQAEEAQQTKTTSSASNTAGGRKTRKLNPYHEKSKRVPKGK